MIKEMHPHDPQRPKLIEAEALASKIALCETDEQTKRAAIMYSLERTVENFPVKSSVDRFIRVSCHISSLA